MSRLASLPVSLPDTTVLDGINPAEVGKELAGIFDNLRAESFADDAVWRDSYALTGTLRTFYGAEVFAAWTEVSALAKPQNFTQGMSMPITLPNGSSWIEISYSFETTTAPPLLCTAMLSVVKDPLGRRWKIWVLKTVLDQIKGAPSADVYEPVNIPNGSIMNGFVHDPKYDCVIVGAGQAGLNTAGRCQALGLSYVVLDKNERVGDNWRSRYKTARLHTIREYSHLPFERTFKEDYPEFLSKDDLAQGYNHWVEKYHINTSMSTTLVSGQWHSEKKQWTLNIREDGKEKNIVSSFVIMAVGAGGQIPILPQFPGREKFKGTVLHSEEYICPDGFKGKNGIVVGSANTAHDIAEDFLEAGLASSTMVQRSETFVLPVEWYCETQKRTYNATFPTALADKLTNSPPLAVTRLASIAAVHVRARMEPERFEALRKAGFRVNPFGDPIWHLLERLGGHYMDIGASEKIAKGQIKMKSDAALTEFTETGLGFSDGTQLPADIVVFATGFDLNIRNRVRELFGDDVAGVVDDFSRVNDEGELSGAWKFQHPGLACNGGAIGPSRWYSRFLALYIKAATLGTPLQQYTGRPKLLK